MNFSLTNMSVAPGRLKALTAPPWGVSRGIRGAQLRARDTGRLCKAGPPRAVRAWGMFHLIFEIVDETYDRFEHDRRLIALRRMPAIGEPKVIEALGIGRVARDHVDLRLCAVLVVFA